MGTSTALMQADDGRDHCCLDRGPGVDDLRIVEPQRLVPEGGRRRIPHQVPVAVRGTFVVPFPVRFENEAPIQYEVDPPDARDRHLAVEADTPQMQAQTQEGLEATVGVGSCKVDEPLRASREPSTDAAQSSRSDLALSERGLERREENLVAATAMDVDEHLLERSKTDSGVPRIPVPHARTASVMCTPAATEPDVNGFPGGESPHAVQPQRVRAGERTSMRRSHHETRVRSR